MKWEESTSAGLGAKGLEWCAKICLMIYIGA